MASHKINTTNWINYSIENITYKDFGQYFFLLSSSCLLMTLFELITNRKKSRFFPWKLPRILTHSTNTQPCDWFCLGKYLYVIFALKIFVLELKIDVPITDPSTTAAIWAIPINWLVPITQIPIIQMICFRYIYLPCGLIFRIFLYHVVELIASFELKNIFNEK